MHAAKFLIQFLRDRQHQVGAEIGIFEGDTTYGLLSNLEDIDTLFCIDMWTRYRDFEQSTPKKKGRVATADLSESKKIFLKKVEPWWDKLVIIHDDSLCAASSVVDSQLDFVFIDACHAHDYVLGDIIAWTPKVRVGGVILGHDYVEKPGYGVKTAVKAAFGKNFDVDNKSRIWYHVREENDCDSFGDAPQRDLGSCWSAA